MSFPRHAALAGIFTFTLALPALAAAEPAHVPGTRLGVSLAGASNVDPDQTIDDATYLASDVGYTFAFGTEPFLTAGLGVGGKEGSLITFGAGLRQRFRLGAVEPFLQAGYHYVGDGEPLHLTPGAGAGLDLRLSDRALIGFAITRFFQQQTDQATLDTSARAGLTLQL